MKVKLNNYILDGRSFLTYIYENHQIQHTDYAKYVSGNDDYLRSKYPKMVGMCDLSGIDIYPYLYTIEVVTRREQINFKRFFLTYLGKVDQTTYDMQVSIDDIVGKSLDSIAMFIITVQYFFL